MNTLRTPLVVGNWKMHGCTAQNTNLVADVLRARTNADAAQCVLCPPFVYLPSIAEHLARQTTPQSASAPMVQLGAQNLSEHTAQGAYTGEISAQMLRDIGCSYVIVGHSERRALYGETDLQVARKVAAALAADLIPIVCVGETLIERDAGLAQAVISRQLAAVLDLCGAEAFRRSVLAYEPVWAIGTGQTATPEQAQEIHAFIRARIAVRDDIIGSSVRLLYGGSVKVGNAHELFAMPDIDGGLIGGASLKAEEFVAIVAAAGPCA